MSIKLNYSKSIANEFESLFRYYPAELIEAALIPLMAKETDYCIEEPMNITHVFYEELNEIIQRNLFNYRQRNSMTVETPKLINESVSDMIEILQALIPIAYIFCKDPEHVNASFVIILKKDVYKPIGEIKVALNFALVTYPKINCMVYAYGTINDLLNKGDFYFSKICTAQNCIYQAINTYQLPQSNQSILTEINEKTKKNFRQFEQKSTSFLENAKCLTNRNEHALSIFMQQQACEFIYRGLISALTGKNIKSHDLLALRKHVSLYEPNVLGKFFHKHKKEERLLSLLNDAYTKSRYDNNYKIDSSETTNLLMLTGNLIKNISTIFSTYLPKG